MVRRRISVRECDICGSNKDVLRIRVDIEGQPSRQADICVDHRRSIQALRDKLDTARPPRLSVASMPVVSMDEVHAAADAARRELALSERSQKSAATRAATAAAGGVLRALPSPTDAKE